MEIHQQLLKNGPFHMDVINIFMDTYLLFFQSFKCITSQKLFLVSAQADVSHLPRMRHLKSIPIGKKNKVIRQGPCVQVFKAQPLLCSHILILPRGGKEIPMDLQRNTFHTDLFKKGATTNKATCSTKCSATIDGQCQAAISQQATGLELIHPLNLMDELP